MLRAGGASRRDQLLQKAMSEVAESNRAVADVRDAATAARHKADNERRDRTEQARNELKLRQLQQQERQLEQQERQNAVLNRMMEKNQESDAQIMLALARLVGEVARAMNQHQRVAPGPAAPAGKSFDEIVAEAVAKKLDAECAKAVAAALAERMPLA